MPEGDTIYRTALKLRHSLESRRVLAADSSARTHVDPSQLVDSIVCRIESRGKHLLLHFDNDYCLHSHLGMTGSWHLYSQDQAWRKQKWQADVSLKLESTTAVCFTPKTIELLSKDQLRRHRQLRRLGPDLLSSDVDDAEIISRFRVHNSAPIGQAVLNQTIVCGIGNVYKSEILFLAKLNPFLPVGEITNNDISELIANTRQLMFKNLSGYPRRTRIRADGSRHWVYRRKGEACLICSTKISMQRQGDLGRSTYFCPQCQSVSGLT